MQERTMAAGSKTPGLEATNHEMSSLVGTFDWASTPLGPGAAWPDSLKAVVRILLTSRFPMWMAWGPELTFLCNDAYLPTVGLKRDWVIGRTRSGRRSGRISVPGLGMC